MSTIRQEFLSRKSGAIDMVVKTQEADFFGRSTFEELMGQWSAIERARLVSGKTMVEKMQNRYAFIVAILIKTLKLGFYTNNGNEHSTLLHRVVAEE